MKRLECVQMGGHTTQGDAEPGQGKRAGNDGARMCVMPVNKKNCLHNPRVKCSRCQWQPSQSSCCGSYPSFRLASAAQHVGIGLLA